MSHWPTGIILFVVVKHRFKGHNSFIQSYTQVHKGAFSSINNNINSINNIINFYYIDNSEIALFFSF